MRGYPDRGSHGQVVRQVGLRIIRGDLAPGDILDLDGLGEQFEVSRTVVRESLKVLAGKGLVDARPRRGTFVRERAAWNLLDPDVLGWQVDALGDATLMARLAEVRAMVEPAAAALAAQRRDEADLARLATALAGLEAATAPDALVEADLRFHRALLAAGHNKLVEQLGVVIEIGLRARDHYVHTHRVPAGTGLRAHGEVYRAVEAADPERARTAMTRLLAVAADDAEQLAGK